MALGRKKSNKRFSVPRQRRYIPRQTRWAIGITAVAVVVIGLLAAGFVQGWITLPQWPWEKEPEVTVPTQPDPDTVIHVVAGGDVNITDKTVASGGSGYDYSGVLLDVLPVLTGADLTVLNFEGSVYGAPYGSENVSAPTQLLQALYSSGVDVLQTANSKSLNNGLLGLKATNDAIRAAGMQPLGTYADAQEYEKYQGYVIYEIQGIKIALAAFTKGMDGRNLPEGSESCVNLLYTDYSSTYKKVNTDGITEVIRAAQSEDPDIIIALLHWGGENNDKLSSTQQSICSLLEKLGVDAVIGTHSHHVQQMGFQEESGMFLAYSLGDFMGDAEALNTNYSVLLDLEITRNGATGEVSVTGYDYTPIYLHYSEDGSLRLLRIREAMAAYEDNYIGKVTDDVYAAMKTALSRIESRTAG